MGRADVRVPRPTTTQQHSAFQSAAAKVAARPKSAQNLLPRSVERDAVSHRLFAALDAALVASRVGDAASRGAGWLRLSPERRSRGRVAHRIACRGVVGPCCGGCHHACACFCNFAGGATRFGVLRPAAATRVVRRIGRAGAVAPAASGAKGGVATDGGKGSSARTCDSERFTDEEGVGTHGVPSVEEGGRARGRVADTQASPVAAKEGGNSGRVAGEEVSVVADKDKDEGRRTSQRSAAVGARSVACYGGVSVARSGVRAVARCVDGRGTRTRGRPAAAAAARATCRYGLVSQWCSDCSSLL